MGKIWKGSTTFGAPDGRFEDGKIWKGSTTFGAPDGRYEGHSDGAAAAALVLGIV